MPDVAMCASDKDCPLATNCYRSERSGTKLTPHRQFYMEFAPGPNCHGYWPVREPANQHTRAKRRDPS
jgi:hypothetical protein